MSRTGTAPLVALPLVAKGGAAPSRFAPRDESGATVKALGGFLRQQEGRDGQKRLVLQLDASRQRRTMIAAAHLGESAQALLLAALDHYLARVVPTRLDRKCSCLEDGEASTDEGGVALPCRAL